MIPVSTGPVVPAQSASAERLAGPGDPAPDFVIDTFDHWSDNTDAMVAPTVCSCFRH
jgi:hypothetical protein